MAVNSCLISELFSGDVTKKLHSDKCKYPIKYATIYNPLLKIKSDAVYLIVDPTEFPEDKNNVKSTFVVLGHMRDNVLNEVHHDVICLNAKYTLGKAYEMILGLIDKYNQWEDSMNQILIESGTIDDFCKISFPLFDNPMYIVSGDFKVLAMGQSSMHPFSEKIQDSKGNLCKKRVLSLISGSYKNNKITIQLNENSNNRISTLKMPIEYNKQIWGYVCLDDECRPFSDGDYTRLCMMEHYIHKYIEMSPNVQNAACNRFKNFLSEYMYSDIDLLSQLNPLLEAMEWKNEDKYVCCTLYVRQNQISSYLCGYIEQHNKGLVSFPFENKIDVLCNITHMNSSNEEWIHFFEKLSEDFGVFVGISTPFYDCSKVKEYFQQSEATAKFYVERRQFVGVYFFENCRLSYILENGVHALPLIVLITPELQDFLLDDAKNNYENYHILRCYIQNNLNISDTIGELFLHRSSFIYRLEKIKKILHSDLDKKEEQLYLRIIIYAIDQLYMENQEDFNSNENMVLNA